MSVLMQDKNLDQELKAGTVGTFEKAMFMLCNAESSETKHLEEVIGYAEKYRLRRHSHRVMPGKAPANGDTEESST